MKIKTFFLLCICFLFLSCTPSLVSDLSLTDENNANEQNTDNEQGSDEDNEYTVIYYLQNVSLTDYEEDSREVLSGVVGELTAASSKNYSGFTVQPFEQKTIASDNTTIIRLYYDRNQIILTFDLQGGGGNTNLTGYYGQSLSVTEPKKEGCSFNGWTPELPETFPSENSTYVATWVEEEAIPELSLSVVESKDIEIIVSKDGDTGYIFEADISSVPSLTGATFVWEVDGIVQSSSTSKLSILKSDVFSGLEITVIAKNESIIRSATVIVDIE